MREIFLKFVPIATIACEVWHQVRPWIGKLI